MANTATKLANIQSKSKSTLCCHPDFSWCVLHSAGRLAKCTIYYDPKQAPQPPSPGAALAVSEHAQALIVMP